MNSEELELSLRTEFENYLKNALAGMRQDVEDFQSNFEAEFEKHKAQLDDAFRNLSARFESDVKFDKAFTESVIEHLRLARDDGAQLTAKAFGEAQKLEQREESAKYDSLRDAINDISSQATQAAILKSLVDHVSRFTARGAFFIVKHDSFVCWRKFGQEAYGEDDSVREINFSVSADTLLADATRSLTTKDSSSAAHTEDSIYLDALGFGRPDQMYAVPLTARGRGVAVLYADQYADGTPVNLEAIESLVRVAGLTVELRAAAVAPQTAVQPAPAPYAPAQEAATQPAAEEQPVEQSAVAEEPAPAPEQAAEPVHEVEQEMTPAATEFEEYTGAVEVEEEHVQETWSPAHSHVEPAEEQASYFEPVAEEAAPEARYEETVEPAQAETVSDFAFASSDAYDASAEVEPEQVEEYAYASEPQNGINGHSYEAAQEPVVEVAAPQQAKSRFSDRNVDLPIEVSDDERRLHNDARRFARLLVSEIKLYNEQKVNEGRNIGDLYDRLREAIDRSREMYDKRVQPQVAAKFDYFHYELVSNLAEGNSAKLGASYPGATV